MQIVTNNPRVKDEITDTKIIFVPGDYLDVLEKVKDIIISDHVVLLTHPLSSSLKPNETYYKSIILTTKSHMSVDLESLEMIESAIRVTHKFHQQEQRPNWSETTLADFALIDYDLIKTARERMQIPPNFM